ncbi:putative multidrug resistance protein fnx1 [Triangularia setosa]|uniref:Multidrug resistance protein fnx1 n=1 Tax=Triangularia setosa TaxID=2587417 RepID=A0AAN7A7N2_9PEZI|nr:putative multidrug resistance protein fnx1 [Podospora setosa]
MVDRIEHEQTGDGVGERTSLLRQPTLNVVSPDALGVSANDEHNRPGASDGDLSPTSTVGSHQSWDSGQWKKNLVLLLGVFLVNSDSAILMAMFRDIASEFEQLSSASWIINAYIIGIIAAQPLYGKLSDIYGRKPLLLFAYICYCVGAAIAGAGFSFWGLLLGRSLCGIGNAGITVLISTLIVDLVPMREVAVWRGYVYAINQIGRALGPSLGGIISDSTNWRWALLYHVPINLAGLIFIWAKMSFPKPAPPDSKGTGPSLTSTEHTAYSKFKRIDLSGSTSLALANVSLLLFLDQVQKAPDNLVHNAMAMVSISTWLGFLVMFLLVEAFWAREPIFPLRLLRKRNVVSAYLIQFVLTTAQVALYTSIPLYFRVTMSDNNTTSSLRLLVMTLGTVAGSLISGYVIKRTGLYRLITNIAVVLSNLSFLAIFFRWRGVTNWADTFYGFPIGVGFGISLSAAFIALTSGLEPTQVAVATSGFYLSMNLGSLLGVSSASLLIASFVERTLRDRLSDLPDKEEIIRDVLSNFDTIDGLPKKIANIVLKAYEKSFVNVWLFCVAFGIMGLIASFVMREGQLHQSPTPFKTKRPEPRRGHQSYGAISESDTEGDNP